MDSAKPQGDVYGWSIVSVRLQIVDFGSEQGLSDFETGGVVGYVEDLK